MAALYTIPSDQPILFKANSEFASLTPEEQAFQQEWAESLLGLVAPAYRDTKIIAQLIPAIVMQIMFQLKQGLTPLITGSQTRPTPGDTTVYRDRYLHPGAARIATRVTDTVFLGIHAPTPGA